MEWEARRSLDKVQLMQKKMMQRLDKTVSKTIKIQRQALSRRSSSKNLEHQLCWAMEHSHWVIPKKKHRLKVLNSYTTSVLSTKNLLRISWKLQNPSSSMSSRRSFSIQESQLRSNRNSHQNLAWSFLSSRTCTSNANVAATSSTELLSPLWKR